MEHRLVIDFECTQQFKLLRLMSAQLDNNQKEFVATLLLGGLIVNLPEQTGFWLDSYEAMKGATIDLNQNEVDLLGAWILSEWIEDVKRFERVNGLNN